MVARERIANENNVHFILFSIPRGNQSIKKIFLKVLQEKEEGYCFHKFCKGNSFLDEVKTKDICYRLKDKKIICKSSICRHPILP